MDEEKKTHGVFQDHGLLSFQVWLVVMLINLQATVTIIFSHYALIWIILCMLVCYGSAQELHYAFNHRNDKKEDES